MKVHLKCFANLPEKYDCDYTDGSEHDIQPEETVAQFAARLNISNEDIKIIFINGKKAGEDSILKDGDRVAFAPAIGGM
jgi:molybdopterin converting factor small subunit